MSTIETKTYTNNNVNYDKLANVALERQITSWRVNGDHSIAWKNLNWEVNIL